MRPAPLLGLALTLVFAAGAGAQERGAPVFIRGERVIQNLVIAIDDDDDDDDGISDATQEVPPPDDAVRVHLGGHGRATLSAQGALRVLWAGRPLSLPAQIRLPAEIRIQAVGSGAGEIRLRQNQSAVLRTTHVGIHFVDASGSPLVSTVDSLAPTFAQPNDATLPRTLSESAEDSRAFYVQVSGLEPSAERRWLDVVSRAGDERRSVRRIELNSGGRSPWLRLVSDALEESAPGAARQLLHVHVGDQVEASVLDATQSLRVGRPDVERGDSAVRHLELALTLLAPRGSPAVGGAPEAALRLSSHLVQSVADAWSPCLVHVRHTARLSAPPPPALLSVSDEDGLPARGGGAFHFQAGVELINVESVAGDSPFQSAERIAEELRAHSFSADVLRVPATTFGAGPGADIVVRDDQGFLVHLRRDPEHALSSDARQSLDIAEVHLADGLAAFDNHRPGGTLEERALVALLRDDDPRTVDVFVIGAFTGSPRQGEAFIPSDVGPAAGAVIIDRRGAAYARTAWTLAHEVGHVLLNDPFHPDNFGPDTPHRLMDSNRHDGTLEGPRRVTPEECARVRSSTTPHIHSQ
ncbi:MAG: hypothetical protein ACI9KE_005209 [Polyangiales bacterium]